MAEIVTNQNDTMKILVADDSPTYRGIFQALLTEWQFNVVQACDGDEALRIYQEGDGPLLALLDWEMPKMNGVELCHQIRQMASIFQPYIIMVTTREKGSDKVCALDSGADDFVGKPFDEEELQARLNVGKRTIALQHRLTQSLAKLENTMQEQQRTEAKLREALAETKGLVSSISMILIEIDNVGRIHQWNKAAEQTFNIPASSVVGASISDLNSQLWDWPQIMEGIRICEQNNGPLTLNEVRFSRSSGNEGGVLRISLNPLFTDSGTHLGLLLLGEDITKRKQLETQLSLAQKMESIGQLAAGIAHEINTPTQFVSDNLRFLMDSFKDIQMVLEAYNRVVQNLPRDVVDSQLLDAMNETVAEADLDYVTEEIPQALQQSLEGADRIGKIVRAMKQFSHPGTEDKNPIDLNQAIESTITVARNEWKYVAEMVTDFDSTLPLVPCLPGEFNQVILNLLINAAHSIGAALETREECKGTITISTRQAGEWVEIRITDTGTGIPEAVRNKIFDPFFTTKEVGKGTGQGLAIAHDVIVNKHGGRLTFETALGTGTTFVIQLPYEQLSTEEGCDETSNLAHG